MNGADRIRYQQLTGDTESHTVVCDTSEARVIPAYLVETLIPGLEDVYSRIQTFASDYNQMPRTMANDLLRLEVVVQVFKGQLATASQEQPYDCTYNDEAEGYRDGDTFTWICPQCGREQDTILPTAAELREESQ